VAEEGSGFPAIRLIEESGKEIIMKSTSRDQWERFIQKKFEKIKGPNGKTLN
jgi:hypothetical protein